VLKQSPQPRDAKSGRTFAENLRQYIRLPPNPRRLIDLVYRDDHGGLVTVDHETDTATATALLAAAGQSVASGRPLDQLAIEYRTVGVGCQ